MNVWFAYCRLFLVLIFSFCIYWKGSVNILWCCWELLISWVMWPWGLFWYITCIHVAVHRKFLILCNSFIYMNMYLYIKDWMGRNSKLQHGMNVTFFYIWSSYKKSTSTLPWYRYDTSHRNFIKFIFYLLKENGIVIHSIVHVLTFKADT